MINILFVCLGNICRSPIAEETMRQIIENKGLTNNFSVDSAGTMDYHIGKLPDPRTRKNAEQHGLNLTHKCRQLSIQDFSDFDYIIAMDQSNLDNINLLSLAAFGRHQPEDNCFLLRRFDTKFNQNKEVPDPYYGTKNDFEEVFQTVNRCNEKLLNWLIEKNG